MRYLLLLLSVLQICISFGQDPNFHIYLCFGQSNMAGAGDIETQDRTVDSRFQFMKPQDCNSTRQFAGNWYTAVPPLWGCTGGLGPADYFGRTMVANQPSNIKIGVVVVAIPGCKIELFGKTGYEGLDTYNNIPSKYAGSAYAWMLDLAKKAQQTGVIKGFLLHQGESNSGDQQWPNKVKGVYDNLIRDLGLNAAATPLLAGELLYQNSCCSGHNQIINRLPSILPNSHVISASGLLGKDVYHFNSAGVRIFGQRYAEKMLALSPKGTPPVVSITAPAHQSNFTSLQNITITANASDADGSVVKVDFYDGTSLIGSDQTAPYSLIWSGMAVGSHSLTVKATDNTGLVTTSSVVTVSVQGIQAPFKGTAFQIPGRIEAEDYDLGGEGTSFHEADASGNQGGASYRTDQVDIETTSDIGGGYNLAYILSGEWLEYTVNVTNTAVYNLDLRMASDGAGKTLHIEMDGVNISGSVTVPNTGGWQIWQTVSLSNINLTQGQHVMRVVFDASYMNLNYLEFKSSLITDLDYTELKGVEVYPNPFTKSGLHIKSSKGITYYIQDMTGIQVEAGSIIDGEMVGKTLPAGLYILTIQSPEGTQLIKIAKQ